MALKFNCDLLLIARHARGMDQRALADFADIDQTYLSKIENGLREPTEEVLSRIAHAVKFPVEFFFQSNTIYGLPASVQPMYRKKASVAQKVLQTIHAQLNIRLMHMKRLFEPAEFTGQFPMPECDVDEYHGDIEAIAGLVRQTWLLPPGPIKNLTECIERAGAVIILHDFADAAIDGLSFPIPGMPPCIFLNSKLPADRMRFTLAHELGHIVLHKIPSVDMDQEAHKFASAFLMPERDIVSSLYGRITLIRLAKLKLVWRVAMQAILKRAGDLNLLSENQSRYLWQQMSANNLRLRESPELDFEPEYPTALSRIIRIHLEDLGYTVEELAKALCLYEEEFRSMYGLPTEKKAKNHLKVVS